LSLNIQSFNIIPNNVTSAFGCELIQHGPDVTHLIEIPELIDCVLHLAVVHDDLGARTCAATVDVQNFPVQITDDTKRTSKTNIYEWSRGQLKENERPIKYYNLYPYGRDKKTDR